MKKIRRFLGGLLIAAAGTMPSIGSATLLKVDIGRTGQDVQAGFVGLSGAGDATTASGNVGSVGFALSDGAGFRQPGTLGRDEMTSTLGDLAEDFYFGVKTVNLTFTDLTAGNYSFTSWSHDSGYTQATYRIDFNGTNLLSGITATTGASPAAITFSTVSFYSDGVGDDVFSFIKTQESRTGSAVILNGFTLQSVPEPGTVALLGLGLLGLAASRKRR